MNGSWDGEKVKYFKTKSIHKLINLSLQIGCHIFSIICQQSPATNYGCNVNDRSRLLTVDSQLFCQDSFGPLGPVISEALLTRVRTVIN